MNMSFEDLVRERAYHLWLAGGMADGHEHEHWTTAEAAIKAAHAEPVVIITKPAKAAGKAAIAAKAKAAPKSAKAAKPAAKSAKPAAKKAAKAEVRAAL